MATEVELIDRAMRAHYRASKRESGIYAQPSAASSGLEEVDGQQLVVLRNVRGVLRVYKVRSGDRLAQVKQWPDGLETY